MLCTCISLFLRCQAYLFIWVVEIIEYMYINQKENVGNSLVVHWLGLDDFTAVARVQFLVRELRSHKPCGAVKKETKKERKGTYCYFLKSY